MNETFALVYADYEGLNLLELGDKDFVWKKYNEYIDGLRNFKEKFGDIIYSKDYNCDDWPDELLELDRTTNFYSQDNPERYCIMGYKDGKVRCVCDDFGIGLDKPIFY